MGCYASDGCYKHHLSCMGVESVCLECQEERDSVPKFQKIKEQNSPSLLCSSPHPSLYTSQTILMAHLEHESDMQNAIDELEAPNPPSLHATTEKWGVKKSMLSN